MTETIPRETVADKFRRAIRTRDAALAGHLADRMRYEVHATYREILEVAQSLTGCTMAEWDDLLAEAEVAR